MLYKNVLNKTLISFHQCHRWKRTFSEAAHEIVKTPHRTRRDLLKLSLIGTGGLMLTSAAITKYIHDEVGGTEGLKRTIAFYSLAIPKYIQYRYHQIVDSPDHVWEELDKETSKQGLDKILELRGFYIKSGQMCAANIGNAFPRVWQETMSVLQNKCPHKSMDVVRTIVQAEYGRPLEEVFSFFDPEPLGAASIGQVHRAQLKNGKKVVVKVQYPEVEDLFRGDVRTIKMFCSVAQPVHVPPLEEIEKQFMTEFDYSREAEQMNRIKKNLEAAGLAGKNKLSIVPAPIMDLCKKRILVMEELDGIKLPDALQRDFERYASSQGLSLNEFKMQEEEKLRKLRSEGGNLNGPSTTEFATYINLLNMKRKTENVSAFLHNWTIGWVPGTERKSYQGKDILPLNLSKLVDDLIMIHGHEVLVDGYFQGDPHPGNVIICLSSKRNDMKLGLIDYGQVKEITKDERLLMCKIIIALADDDKDKIVRLMKEAGYRSKGMNPEMIYKYAKVSYDEDNDELTEGKHIQMFLEDLQALDPIDNIPQQFIMVGRTSVMLRGVAHALRQSRSVAKAWRPIAEKVLKEEGLINS
jgi:aarF domain-containing kinase